MAQQTPNPDRSTFQPGQQPIGDIDLAQLGSHCQVIDVRSPIEFEQDHLPGARNIPLLEDRERAVVGTLYRTEGKDSANDWALQAVQSRSGEFLQALLDNIDRQQEPVICCARGGDRSGNVVQFLNHHDISARRLTGGYRSYRKQVMERLDQIDIPQLWILDGLTGAGKTRVLHEISTEFPGRVLDLEAYAGHRSSILGDVGMTPTRQKTFESLLVGAIGRLEVDAPWVLIEGESRKVGDRQIPDKLWQQMQVSPRIELVQDIETRARLLVEEYRTETNWDPLIVRLESLRGYDPLGSKGVDEVQTLLRNDQPMEAAIILLERHYDPRYLHGSEQKDFRFSIEEPSLEVACQQIVAKLEDQGRGALSEKRPVDRK
ncbi:MAG: tRNA 2-selenouridine(34) synthase MnmH [Planctomycetota bacterium]|nr:tRNA 2-selenouridine(34) synthase MnmH [Planctomycetota bacterium]